MKHTKLVMLGILTSSLYASGFYGGVDIGASIINAKANGYAGINVQELLFDINKSKVKLAPGVFVGYKINSEANGGGRTIF